jgi:putative aminopeptidase FrvX
MSMAKMFGKSELAFFEKYINNAAPTGYEWNGQKIWLDYISKYIDTHQVDNYGTVYGVINPEAEFKVVIEAHADEIPWYVSYITDDGFIYVKRNGGSYHMIAPSKRVNIHTKKGFVPAVFGWPAIHTRRGGKDPELKTDSIFLDCGATTKQEILDMGIHVGSVITYQDEFMILNKKYAVGRALDNRAGGVVIAMVAKMLKENKKTLPFGLYIVNAVQEEVGLRGAEMITQTIKPNVAIVTDVAHDTTTPMINKKTEGDFKCGTGPILTYGPAVHNKLLDLIIDTAEENKIPFQRDAASRATGTDTDAFAYSNGGVPSALISFPLRYMHTTVEMVDLEDMENAAKLIYHTLLKLTPDFNFKYL